MILQRTHLLVGGTPLQPGTLTLQGIQFGLCVAQSDLAHIAAGVSSIETCPKLGSLPVDGAQTKAGLVTREQRLAGARALVLRLGTALRCGHVLLCKLGLLVLVARGIAAGGCTAYAAKEASLRRIALLRRACSEAEQRASN